MSSSYYEITCFHRLPQSLSTSLHIDNTSALQIEIQSSFSWMEKHIEVDYHFIHDAYDH